MSVQEITAMLYNLRKEDRIEEASRLLLKFFNLSVHEAQHLLRQADDEDKVHDALCVLIMYRCSIIDRILTPPQQRPHRRRAPQFL